MTDRHSGYVVTLAEDIREDDAEAVIAALQMIRGVQSVQPVTGDVRQIIVASRRDVEWRSRLDEVMQEMRRS